MTGRTAVRPYDNIGRKMGRQPCARWAKAVRPDEDE
jgi:hypothetical protein